MADFCELSHRVDFNDVTLKDICQFGIDEPLRSSLPGGKICWSLERYIDYVLSLAGSLFTVGVADEETRNCSVPAPEHLYNPTFMSGVIHIMPATPKPAHVMSATPRPANIVPAAPGPAIVTPATPGPAIVMQSTAEPAHAMPSTPEPAHAMPSAQEPAHAMPSTPEPAHSMPSTPEPAHVMPSTPESAHVMPASPEPAPPWPPALPLPHAPSPPLPQVLFPFTGLALHPAPWTMSVPPPLHHPPGLFGFCFCFVWASGAALRGRNM